MGRVERCGGKANKNKAKLKTEKTPPLPRPGGVNSTAPGAPRHKLFGLAS
jgi:hypothetical protein